MQYDEFMPDANPDHDKSLYVQFYYEPVRLGFRSEQEGRDIFEDRPYVKIVTPGLNSTETVREATTQDKMRFQRQWMAFESSQQVAVQGTPIEGWPVLSRSQVEELKYMKFMTVEQIAAASDAQVQALGGGYSTLREKAKAFLDLAKDSAAAEKLAADNKRKDDEISDLKSQIAELARRFEEANREANNVNRKRAA
jgi:cell division protein FtsB